MGVLVAWVLHVWRALSFSSRFGMGVIPYGDFPWLVAAW